MDSLAKLAEATALELDAKRPGWAFAIDKKSLDMTFCAHCVIGQLDGSFSRADLSYLGYRGKNYFADKLRWASKKGLNVEPGLPSWEYDKASKKLADIWIGLIDQRLGH